MQDQNMAMFQQLLQNPQALQRLQDPAMRGQLAQQLAGQFQAPPPEASNGWAVRGDVPMGLSNPQQSLPRGTPGGAPAGGPPQTNPFAAGLTTPLGSNVPVQFDRNGVPQTPFLPVAAPNQAPFVPGNSGADSAALGQARNAFSQAQGLLPGGSPQPTANGPDLSYIQRIISMAGGSAGAPSSGFIPPALSSGGFPGVRTPLQFQSPFQL